MRKSIVGIVCTIIDLALGGSPAYPVVSVEEPEGIEHMFVVRYGPTFTWVLAGPIPKDSELRVILD